MKNFNIADFNIDGNKFVSLTFEFTLDKGIVIELEDKAVSVRSSVTSAAGCDFVVHGSSCASKNFYEASGLPEINDLFFKYEYNFKLRGFVYALPANADQVKAELSELIKGFITGKVAQIEQTLERLTEFTK